jgi:hypothetical protein
MVDRRLLRQEAHGVTDSPVRGIQRSDSPRVSNPDKAHPGFRTIPLLSSEGLNYLVGLARMTGTDKTPSARREIPRRPRPRNA